MDKILFDEMSKIVEKNVKYYKTDFYNIDVKSIENYDSNEFLWIVRESGTLILNINNLKYERSCDYISFLYYKETDVKLYKVNLQTLKIKQLDYLKTFEKVIENLEIPKNVELTVNNEVYSVDINEYSKYGFLDKLVERYKIKSSVAVEKIRYVF